MDGCDWISLYVLIGEEIEANKREGGESMNEAADEGGARMRVGMREG